MAVKYGVDSLHINVGDGECTLHLLVSPGEKSAPGHGFASSSKRIHKAILVDTGPAVALRNGQHVLPDVLRTVSLKYAWNEPKLDAIVISSWHPDYYEGLFELLDLDAGDTSPLIATKDDPGAEKRSRWLKYDEHGEPLTTLYAPSEPPLSVPELSLNAQSDKLSYSSSTSNSSNSIRMRDFCRFEYHHSKCLGLEIFSGSMLGENVSTQAIKSPSQLLEYRPPAESQPGLYFICHGDLILGSNTSQSSTQGSIALALLWKGSPVRVSYYGSGPVDSTTETALLDWLSTTSDGTQKTPPSVTFMKLGLHSNDFLGSFRAVETLRPQNIVMSCGNKYDNPRIELVMLLHAWSMLPKSNFRGAKRVYATQYPYYFLKEMAEGRTRYKDFTESGQSLYSSFFQPQQNKTFASVLSGLYSDINAPLRESGLPACMDPYQDFDFWLSEYPESDKSDSIGQDARDWITEQCEYRWAQISPISATSHEVTAGAVQGTTLRPLSTQDVIEYICLESRDPAENRDGQVLIQHLGSFQEVCNEIIGSKSIALHTMETSEILNIPASTGKSLSQPADNPILARVSQFPGLSLSKLGSSGKSPVSRSGVFTGKNSYPIETAFQPTGDDWEAFHDFPPIRSRKELNRPAKSGTNDEDKMKELKVYKFSSWNLGGDSDNWICWTKLNTAGKGGEPATLGGDGDNFLASLNSHYMWLTANPRISKDCSFDSKDELYQWLTLAVTATSLDISLDQQNKQKVRTVKLTTKESYKFSTEHNEDVFDLSDSLKPNLFSDDMDGLLADRNMLVLGLDPTTVRNELTLKQAMEAFGLNPLVTIRIPENISNIKIILDTARGSRNAFFFEPDKSYMSTIRLQYLSSEAGITTLNTWLARIPNLSATALKVILKKRTNWVAPKQAFSKSECELVFQGTLHREEAIPLNVTLVFTQRSVKFDILVNTRNVMGALLTWIRSLLQKNDEINLEELLASDTAKKVVKYPQVRRVSIVFDLTSEDAWLVSGISIDIELQVAYGKPEDSDFAMFLFTYSWSRGTWGRLRGVLWTRSPLSLIPELQRLSPDWEASKELKPIDENKWAEYLALNKLLNTDKIPKSLPTRIYQAMIEMGSTRIEFGGVMASEQPDPTEPRAYLGKLMLRMVFSAREGSFKLTEARLGVDVNLVSPDTLTSTVPARLLGRIAYHDDIWTLAGVIKDFDFCNLYTFFAKQTKVALTVLLRWLRIEILAVVCELTDDGNDFTMEGTIKLGGMALNLSYKYGILDDPSDKSESSTVNSGNQGDGVSKTQKGWKMSISRSSTKSISKVKVGHVLQSLMGYERTKLPPFIGNSEVFAFRAHCRVVTSTDEERAVCLAAAVKVLDKPVEITVSYVVHRNLAEAWKAHTKHYIQASLPRLFDPKVPLIGAIQKPIDELLICYVRDVPPRVQQSDSVQRRGLTEPDIKRLNIALINIGLEGLVYRKIKDPMGKLDTAIAEGFHFMIIAIDGKRERRVFLDYMPFQKTDKKKKKKKKSPAKDGSSKDKQDPATGKKPGGSGGKDGKKDNAKDSVSVPETRLGERPQYDSESDYFEGGETAGNTEDEAEPESAGNPEGRTGGTTVDDSEDEVEPKKPKNPGGIAGEKDGENTGEKEGEKTGGKRGDKTGGKTGEKTGGEAGEKEKPKEEQRDKRKDKNDKQLAKPAPKQTAPFKREGSTLDFRNVGLEYKDNTLYLYLDAKCIIGPLGVIINGLWFSITFSHDDTLQNLKVKEWSVGFRGLIGAFNHDPITLSIGVTSVDSLRGKLSRQNVTKQEWLKDGKVRSVNNPTGRADLVEEILKTAQNGDEIILEGVNLTSGGGILGIKRFSIQGAGAFSSITQTTYSVQEKPTETGGLKKDSGVQLISVQKGDPVESRTLFVFFKLEGVFIKLGWATITGATFALGINFQLRWPRIQEVQDFPLVAQDRWAEKPMDQLNALLDTRAESTSGGLAEQNRKYGWFTPKLDEKWFAGGLKVQIAESVDLDVALIVQWSPSLRFGLVGTAKCELPKQTQKKYLGIKLGFLVTVDPSAGEFRLEAELDPGSFILDPECHLRGGMAFCVWWKPRSLDKNLGANDEHGDWVLTIGGYHSRFTIPAHYPRPEKLAIDWAYSSNLKIRGEAYFAITPKACMGGGMLSITYSKGKFSAWFNAYLDFLVNYSPFHFIVSGGVSVGAKYTFDVLFVEHTVEVNVGANFEIEGPPVRGVVTVHVLCFNFPIKFGSPVSVPAVPLHDFYRLVLETGKGDNTSSSGKAPVSFNADSGLIPSSSKEDSNNTQPWSVRSGPFYFSVKTRFPVSAISVNNVPIPVTNEQRLWAKPMKSNGALTSELSLTITKVANPDKIDWSYQTTRQGLPKGLWDEYQSWKDPDSGSSNTTDLLNANDGTILLTTGLIIKPPPPQIALDELEPVDIQNGQKETVLETPASFPGLEIAQSSFSPDISADSLTSPERWDRAAAIWGAKRPEAQSIAGLWTKGQFWADDTNSLALDLTPPAKFIDERDRLWIEAPMIGFVEGVH